MILRLRGKYSSVYNSTRRSILDLTEEFIPEVASLKRIKRPKIFGTSFSLISPFSSSIFLIIIEI